MRDSAKFGCLAATNEIAARLLLITLSIVAKLFCHVVPNAKQDKIAGQVATVSPLPGRQATAIKIKLRAPAVEGKANAALLKFLAEKLQIAVRDIVLEQGEKSRRKVVRIDVLSEPELWRRLSAELSGK